MSLIDMSREELEILSYTDLTYMILKENKKPMSTADIFKYICELLDYSDDDYANKIADYYTSLTMDKRFILLDSNEWDLRENHSVEIAFDEEDEELEKIDEELEDEKEEEDLEELEEDFEDNVDIPLEDDDLDDEDDDLDDLAIIPDEELEES